MGLLNRVSMTPEERQMYRLAAQINKAAIHNADGALWQASVMREQQETFAVLVIYRSSLTAVSTLHTLTSLEQFERVRAERNPQ